MKFPIRRSPFPISRRSLAIRQIAIAIHNKPQPISSGSACGDRRSQEGSTGPPAFDFQARQRYRDTLCAVVCCGVVPPAVSLSGASGCLPFWCLRLSLSCGVVPPAVSVCGVVPAAVSLSGASGCLPFSGASGCVCGASGCLSVWCLRLSLCRGSRRCRCVARWVAAAGMMSRLSSPARVSPTTP